MFAARLVGTRAASADETMDLPESISTEPISASGLSLEDDEPRPTREQLCS
jgi:hypothetical protein